MVTDIVTVNGVRLRIDAARAAEAVGVDPAEDVRRLRTGEVTRIALAAECLDGVDDDRALEDAWREYVSDVCLAAGVPGR